MNFSLVGQYTENMIAVSAASANVGGRPATPHPWHLTLVIMVAINLAAFWFLLQYRYSPEKYRTALVNFGRIEIVWTVISICAAIAVVVSSWRNPDASRRLVRAGLVVTVVSVGVLVETLAGVHLRCLEAILFSAALGWAVVFWLRANKTLDFDQTISLRLGTRCWHPKIVNVLAAAVWLATAGLFFYYMAQQIYYLNNLALGYADCGDYARIMFNTIHNPRELFLRVNPDRPLFYDHIQLGALPFIPLWFLWPDLKLTILLQVLAVLGCALPIYWIGKEVFHNKSASLLLAVVWLVFPSTSQFIYSGSYGFHFGSLCLPLYFLALVYWIKEQRGPALLFALWAVLIKEEAAILVGTFGLYLIFFEKRRWLGTGIAVTAFAYFLLCTSVIIPSMNHQGYPAQRVFADLGATKWEILFSPWTKPQIFWGKLLTPSTFYFVALLMGPLLFVPLGKPSVLLIGSMILLFDCLYPALKSICYWYQAGLLPVVFWALVEVLRTKDVTWQRATLSGAVVSGILFSIFFGNTFWSETPLLLLPAPGRLHIVQQMGRCIDRGGSLLATQRVAAHFITQRHLYVDSPVPSSIDYALLDLRDSWRETPGVHWLQGLRSLQRQVEARPDLRLVDAEDGLLLYARHGVPINPRTRVERDTLPWDMIHTEWDLAHGAEIVGFRTDRMPTPESNKRMGLMRVTIFSSVTGQTDVDLAVRCILHYGMIGSDTDSFVSELQPLGQGIWPVARWLPGRFYADDFLVRVPAKLTNQPFTITFASAVLNP